MVPRGVGAVLRRSLVTVAIVIPCSNRGWAGGIPTPGAPFDAAAVAEFLAAEATFIIQQEDRSSDLNSLLSSTSSLKPATYNNNNTPGFYEGLGETTLYGGTNQIDPKTGLPINLTAPGPSPSVVAAAQRLTDEWVKSCPNCYLTTPQQRQDYFYGLLQSWGVRSDIAHEANYVVTDPQNGSLPASRTQFTDTSIYIDKNLSKALNLSSEQQLSVFGTLGYGAFWSNAESIGQKTDLGALTGTVGAKWNFNNDYVTAIAGLSSGQASTQSPAEGNFKSELFGAGTDVAVGHVFAFWMPDELLARPDGWRSPWVNIDTAAHVGYWELHGTGFTDGTGTQFDDTNQHLAVTGVSARISIPHFGEGYFMSPYVRVGYDYNFSSGQELGIPVQATLPASQLVVFSLPRDTGWAEAGIKYSSFRNITLTLAANYNISEIGTGYGARLALDVPLDALLPGYAHGSAADRPIIVTKAR
jgi:hypothetical protein